QEPASGSALDATTAPRAGIMDHSAAAVSHNGVHKTWLRLGKPDYPKPRMNLASSDIGSARSLKRAWLCCAVCVQASGCASFTTALWRWGEIGRDEVALYPICTRRFPTEDF